jgi:hypothetical protein
MLYPVIIRTIERGEYDAEGLKENIDNLFAEGRLTPEQYEKLYRLLAEREQFQEKPAQN